MEIILEKVYSADKILYFEEGMKGYEKTIRARFIWKEDKCWNVLVDGQPQPIWLRVKNSTLDKWSPDLYDPATAGIVLNRISNLVNSGARFSGAEILLEDGRKYSGLTRYESVRMAARQAGKSLDLL